MCFLLPKELKPLCFLGSDQAIKNLIARKIQLLFHGVLTYKTSY